MNIFIYIYIYVYLINNGGGYIITLEIQFLLNLIVEFKNWKKKQ